MTAGVYVKEREAKRRRQPPQNRFEFSDAKISRDIDRDNRLNEARNQSTNRTVAARAA